MAHLDATLQEGMQGPLPQQRHTRTRDLSNSLKVHDRTPTPGSRPLDTPKVQPQSLLRLDNRL